VWRRLSVDGGDLSPTATFTGAALERGRARGLSLPSKVTRFEGDAEVSPLDDLAASEAHRSQGEEGGGEQDRGPRPHLCCRCGFAGVGKPFEGPVDATMRGVDPALENDVYPGDPLRTAASRLRRMPR
jgi:hypothetical protein